eukprot:jgi/Tetstr1/463090/TSEL_008024.t1
MPDTQGPQVEPPGGVHVGHAQNGAVVFMSNVLIGGCAQYTILQTVLSGLNGGALGRLRQTEGGNVALPATLVWTRTLAAASRRHATCRHRAAHHDLCYSVHASREVGQHAHGLPVLIETT